MKVKNFFGDNMPILPWMINFDCPNRQCVKQTEAINAPNHLEYQANLTINTYCMNCMLSYFIVTLGINNFDENFIYRLFQDNIRSICLDVSTGTDEEHEEGIIRLKSLVVKYSKEIGRVFPFAICMELTGLRITTGTLDSEKLEDILLEEGHFVYITTKDNYSCHCNKNMIFVNYKEIMNILQPGNLIYIDYGKIILMVEELGRRKMFYQQIRCRIVNGGILRSNAIVHLPNIPLGYKEETQIGLVKFALKYEIDVLIIPHVRNAHQVDRIREQLGEEGNAIMLIARIEDAAGIEYIDEIINAADAIIISRPELGIELPPEKLFIIQKSIIAKCSQAGKPVICAGHFLKSMAKSHLPTRPEMTDVANAILDGTDGLLITEEISNSDNIFETIHNLQRICLEAESAIYQKDNFSNLALTFSGLTEPIYSIALTAVETSYRINAACIIVQSVSGRSAKIITQLKPSCPVIVVTRYGHVARKLNLWRGVIPLQYTGLERADYLKEIDSRFRFAITYGKYTGLIRGGDKLILVSGWKEFSGFTNTMRIVYASQNECIYVKDRLKSCS